MRDYDFKGANINGHIQGRYLDDQFFWPILERAETLRVPIYLHPTQPPQAVIDASYSGFDPMVTNILIGAGWGWHIETAIHVIRMILGGVFDQYPELQIIIGHMGETLPFMLQRMDRIMNPETTKLKRPVSAYLQREYPLHVQRVQLHPGISQFVTGSRRGSDYVFGGSPVCFHGAGKGFLE